MNNNNNNNIDVMIMMMIMIIIINIMISLLHSNKNKIESNKMAAYLREGDEERERKIVFNYHCDWSIY